MSATSCRPVLHCRKKNAPYVLFETRSSVCTISISGARVQNLGRNRITEGRGEMRTERNTSARNVGTGNGVTVFDKNKRML